MKTANELIQATKVNIEDRRVAHEQSMEAEREGRLERARANYESAKRNVPRLCEERIGTLIEEKIEEQGVDNFCLRLLTSIFTDELGNKLFKVVTKDDPTTPVPQKKRRTTRVSPVKDYYSIMSSDFCYKTFQSYLKKHGFRVVQEKSRESMPTQQSFSHRNISCHVIDITFIDPPTPPVMNESE